MALKKGFGAVRAAKEKADRARAAMDAARVYECYLRKDGEEKELWFIGSLEEEPVMVPFHEIKLGKDFFTEVCGAVQEGHDGCVYCWSAAKGAKNVSRCKDMACSSVVEAGWVHKIKNEEKSKGSKFERFDWYDCSDDEKCKLCRKKVKREHIGLRRLRLKPTAASALEATNNALARNCLSCGGRKVVMLLGFRKNGKGKLLPDLEDVEKPELWVPEYECKKCSDPTPGNITLCPITFRRSGTGTSTSYSFVPGPFEDPPEWVQKIKPIQWYDDDGNFIGIIPRTADQMAEKLGVENPFDPMAKKGKKGAKAYDEDDDDDDEDDGILGGDDDDEEDDEDDEE